MAIFAEISTLTSKLNLWHYKDEFLQSDKNLDLNANKVFTRAINLDAKMVTQIDDETHHIISSLSNQYILLKNIVNEDDLFWKKDRILEYSLISVSTGSKLFSLKDPLRKYSIEVSWGEKFLIWFDSGSANYFTYNIETQKTVNISKQINQSLIERGTSITKQYAFGIAGWLKSDKQVLLYDKYDIWTVDPYGHKQPRNITKGLGLAERKILRLAVNREKVENLKDEDKILLTALGEETKYNGFYKTTLKSVLPPVPCGLMEAAFYYFPGEGSIYFTHKQPMKVGNTNTYILQHMSTTKASNLVFTKDFKTFKPITDINPQHHYNWMTSEVLSWILPDGRPCKGILYKPENFDSNGKYPVILNYYDQNNSQVAYLYNAPSLSGGGLDIPWYVSNGYLVFIPDILFRGGKPGKDVTDCVLSAVNCLAKFDWVDTKRLGLQGHSWGGYATNYLITKSNLFAAASSAAGLSDLVQEYGNISFGGKSLVNMTERGQVDLQTTPWDKPQVYVDNSPIFHANKINTPLLLMHNKADSAVPFLQSLEMFNSLRRLNKPVWLLQYDDEGHSIDDNSCKLDFTIRQQQFFDYYLKNKAKPIWMVDGIPAKDKGKISGLELDSLFRNH